VRKYLSKYIVEFMVVVTGVLISFYVEKHRAREYKNNLKNHSLSRLASNIESDLDDSWYNHRLHTFAKDMCDVLLDDYEELRIDRRDSIGKCMGIACKYWTIFMDNPEEYLTLRNSGLIEFVEHDSLIMLLQKKYSSHLLYKQWESLILVNNDHLLQVFNQKTTGVGVTSGYGALRDDVELSHEDFNLIRRRKELSSSYLRDIDESIARDSLILKTIQRLLSEQP